jgi:GGDEF domain-containing protein
VQDEIEEPIPRKSSAMGILILLAAIPPLGLGLHSLAGPLVAAAVCGVYAVALGLTVLAERPGETIPRDPSTGLPNRNAALQRLEGIFAQKLAGSSQAGVFVISIDVPTEDESAKTDFQTTVVVATARLALGLRRGDQIIRIGDHSIAAILGPSRGLTARAAESILDRIDGMFSDPIRVGPRLVPVRVSLGACLQHDAPRADAASWIEAAELAAELAAEEGEPRLFPSGATRVDRSAWDVVELPMDPEAEADAQWRATTARRTEDPEGECFDYDRRRA